MRCHRLRFSVWLCMLLLAQAVLPRDLVCCISEQGQSALELAINGRCIGMLVGSGLHQHDTHSAAGAASTASLQSAHVECEDSAIRSADCRPARLLALEMPPAVALPTAHCFGALTLPLPQFSLHRLQIAAPDCCGPPLRLTGTVLLRI